MHTSFAGRWLVMSCLALLAACGGGGGGSGGGAGGAQLSFSPSTATETVKQGEVGTVTVTATLRNPDAITSTVWVIVEDPDRVLVGGIGISSIDDAHFATTLHTSQSLSLGHHRGSFKIHLCKDQDCTVEWMAVTALPYDFDIEPAPLHALPTTATVSTTPWKSADHDVVQVNVTGGAAWTATSGASWLVVTSGATGTSPGSVSLAFASEALAIGEYTTNVTVSSAGQNVQVPVTLHVIAPQFVIDAGGSPSFTAINGAPIASQGFAFELDNGIDVPWSLSSDSAWLSASATSGVTPANVLLRADPSAGALASGGYTGTLTLSSANVATRQVAAQLQLIKPTLSTAVPSVTLGGDRGRDLATAQSVLLTLNTGTNSYPVSMSALPSWLAITPSQAVVGQTGTPLSIAANVANATPGSNTHSVVFTSVINGDTVTTPLTVNINVDQRRLLPSSWGVGFSSTPTGTLTSRTLQITDNFGGALPWTATSDSAWLSATTNGNTAGTSSLVLTANPAQVPADVVSVASVRIESSTAGVAPAIVRVGMWKSASGLVAITKLAGATTHEMVADKIRPYVYSHSGGPAITVYNAYTAAPVATIANVGVTLGQMAASPDGSTLYVLDTASQSIKVVDLATRTSIGSWPLSGPYPASWDTSLIAVRPNGVEVVLLGDGSGYRNGSALPRPGIQASGHMTATDDGRRLFTTDTGLSPASQGSWTLDWSEISGGLLFATPTGGGSFIGNQSNGRDVAVAPDGSALYAASGAPYECVSINPTTLAFAGYLPDGDAYPNNVEVTWNNRVVCGIDGIYSANDIWVYSSAGATQAAYKVVGYARGLVSREMVVTPDGFIVVALTDDPLLAFVPIGP